MIKYVNYGVQIDFNVGITTSDVDSLIQTIDRWSTTYVRRWHPVRTVSTYILSFKLFYEIPCNPEDSVSDKAMVNRIVYSWCAGKGVGCNICPVHE